MRTPACEKKDCAYPCIARRRDLEAAILHSRATRVDDVLLDNVRAKRNVERNAPAKKVGWVEKN